MEKMMKQLRQHKRLCTACAVLLLLVLCTAGAGVYFARADILDGALTDANDYEFPTMQKDATADTTLRYRTVWYLFADADIYKELQRKNGSAGDGWNDRIQKDAKKIFDDYGFNIDGSVKVIRKGEKQADGSYEVIKAIPGTALINYLKSEGSPYKDRAALTEDITVYLAPRTEGYEGRSVKERAYTLQNAVAIPQKLYGTEWTDGAISAMKENYKFISISFTLQTIPFTVQFLEKGTEGEAEGAPDAEDVIGYYLGKAIYGETLGADAPITAPEIEGYSDSVSYRWSTGGTKTVRAGESIGTYKVDHDKLKSMEELVLTFYYSKEKELLPTPVPETTPLPCEHEWGPWEYNENRHWKECTRCGVKGQEGLHNFTSARDEGNVTDTCTDCGYSYTYHKHRWGLWEFDEAFHWKQCQYCDELKDYAEHRWSGWFTVAGGKRRECRTCGYFVFEGVKYTLTFDKNHPEAEGVMAPQTHTFGTAKAISRNTFRNEIGVNYDTNTGLADDPAEIIHNEYSRAAARKFMGWALAPSAGPQYVDGQVVKDLSLKEGDVIPLYAYWGSAEIRLPDVKWKNHYFLGWSTEKEPSEGAELLIPGTAVPVSSETTFYAQWEPVYYTVSFEPNGGTPCANMEVEAGKPYGPLPSTTKDGFAFGGWLLRGTADTVTADTIVTTEKDHVLEAVWTGIPYTVTFDYNFNYNAAADSPVKNGTDTKTVYYTETYGALPAPSRDGYTFLGWCTSETGGNGSGQLVIPDTEVYTNKDHTLHAKWQVNSYTLNFDYNYDFNVWD